MGTRKEHGVSRCGKRVARGQRQGRGERFESAPGLDERAERAHTPQGRGVPVGSAMSEARERSGSEYHLIPEWSEREGEFTYRAVREENVLRRVADLLGGKKVLSKEVSSSFDAHELILKGIPALALTHLLQHLLVLGNSTSFHKAVGMSLRTMQRRKEISSKPLSTEQSGRMWKFAEILAEAIAVFGSQDDAEQWLERPAIGLDQRRPIDLLETPAGTEIVETFLRRLHYGVYM